MKVSRKSAALLSAILVGASSLALSANAASTYHALVDTSISRWSWTYINSWSPSLSNPTSYNIIDVTGVCLYNGLKKAKCRIYDDNQSGYLWWDVSDSDTSPAFASGETVGTCDAATELGNHSFKFYAKGVSSSGNFSAQAHIH